ncbi:MAG: NTP transferase domain-containing protein [Verrucomicrobiota bacterium]
MDSAVIYAAGRATRLGPSFANTPKILLPLAGRTLLDRHAENLACVGVRNLFLVTGHCRDQIAAVIPELSARHGIRIYELHNPDFTEGSAISMHVSLAVMEAAAQAVLVMDGDVLYGTELLRRLIDSPAPSTMLVDFGVEAQDDDPVLVPIRNGRPFDLVKKWIGTADRVGESVGFFKIAANHIPFLASQTRARTVGIHRRDSLDDVLRSMTMAGLFDHEDITGQPWTEIDFPHDVANARDVVMPALAAAARHWA